jgi:hypothetical protein
VRAIGFDGAGDLALVEGDALYSRIAQMDCRVVRLSGLELAMQKTGYGRLRMSIFEGSASSGRICHDQWARKGRSSPCRAHGLQHVNFLKTGDRSYCIIAEWTDMNALAAARPHMIATLDTFRDTLEDLGGGLGVTDPVSGPVVLALK